MNGYWLSGRITWTVSSPCAATLKITSSNWFGPNGTRSTVSLLDPVLPAPRRPPPARVTHPRPTRLLRMWMSTRSRERSSRPLIRLSQNQARRSPSRAARFGDGGLVQKQNGLRLHVTLSGEVGPQGRLGTLPRCIMASAWRCQLVSHPILFTLTRIILYCIASLYWQRC
jgi:hypothetical protein